jgi:glutathione S-transferase
VLADLGDEKSRADFEVIWPIGKFPVLRDDMRGRTVPESSIIIEYLAQDYPGRARLVPTDADLALDADRTTYERGRGCIRRTARQ